jgi:hypothetical protein
MGASSIEELLAIISQMVVDTNCKPLNLELFVRNTVTLPGQAVSQDIVMAILLDVLLGRGYWPDGFVDSIDGRIYKYKLSDI